MALQAAVKRTLDIVVSGAALVATSPIIALFALAIWSQDWRSPFFLQTRIGRGNRPFTLIKLRSMTLNQSGDTPDTTSRDDPRITPVGRFVRRSKIDELPQFLNVLKGDMSLVGPRPQIPREVALYTPAEMELLQVRPGITDISSIVFVDLEEIAAAHDNADEAYRQYVRPWKGRFGAFYVRNGNLLTDLVVMLLTVHVLIDRAGAWAWMSRYLARAGAPADIVQVASRTAPLEPAAPLA